MKFGYRYLFDLDSGDMPLGGWLGSLEADNLAPVEASSIVEAIEVLPGQKDDLWGLYRAAVPGPSEGLSDVAARADRAVIIQVRNDSLEPLGPQPCPDSFPDGLRAALCTDGYWTPRR